MSSFRRKLQSMHSAVALGFHCGMPKPCLGTEVLLSVPIDLGQTHLLLPHVLQMRVD